MQVIFAGAATVATLMLLDTGRPAPAVAQFGAGGFAADDPSDPGWNPIPEPDVNTPTNPGWSSQSDPGWNASPGWDFQPSPEN
ncbi:hypothetical protein NJB14194_43590 [Mycobacterium montefiorense]|nr:hypothetical protein NJB14192_38300 [Mycobacterium montefiorense]GKU47741.1 hypothetical protein NJB14194_43590 [Mycobacterium montefiorense]GKU52819.1 hypothetical protein NJB14195_40600 [Mycobacterium montefiorense]GKU61915.1 hypothetical protein NJB18182_24170 [Mycobacterium montefiorense]GKU69123.1 hypothetical protein NJB18183_42690 [Mycobacterium montefiorense]